MTTRTRTRFNMQDEMEKALSQILAEKTKSREEYEAKNDTDHQWYADASYTTATDLERKFRDNTGTGYWSRARLQGLGGVSLLHHCRDFLQRHPGLKANNPANSHCSSGMRYRPHDWKLAPSEERTYKAKSKEKPRHYCPSEKHGRDLIGGWYPLCLVDTKLKKKPNWRGRQSRGIGPRVSNKVEEVTCPKCLKAIEESRTDVIRKVRIEVTERKIKALKANEEWEGSLAREARTDITVKVIDVATEKELKRICVGNQTYSMGDYDSEVTTTAKAKKAAKAWCNERNTTITTEVKEPEVKKPIKTRKVLGNKAALKRELKELNAIHILRWNKTFDVEKMARVAYTYFHGSKTRDLKAILKVINDFGGTKIKVKDLK